MESQKLSSQPKEQSITVVDSQGHIHHMHGFYTHWVEGSWVRFKKRVLLVGESACIAPSFVETGSIEFFQPIQVIVE